MASHSVCPSVCLSVCPSVPLSLPSVTSFRQPLASRMYFSARTEGRISYGHLDRTDSCFIFFWNVFFLHLWSKPGESFLFDPVQYRLFLFQLVSYLVSSDYPYNSSQSAHPKMQRKVLLTIPFSFQQPANIGIYLSISCHTYAVYCTICVLRSTVDVILWADVRAQCAFLSCSFT